VFGGDEAQSIAAESFNGVYVTSIGEGGDSLGAIGVSWSASMAEDSAKVQWSDFSDFKRESNVGGSFYGEVVFLGHRSHLVSAAPVNAAVLETDYAAHFSEVVSNARF
jgi:hypothetical protein